MKDKNICRTLLFVAIATSAGIFSFFNFPNFHTHLSVENEILKSKSISSIVPEDFAVEFIDSSFPTGNHFRGNYKNYNYSNRLVFSFRYTLNTYFTVSLPDWESHTSTLPFYLFTRYLIL